MSQSDIEHVTKYIRDRLDSYKYGFINRMLRPQELEHYTLTVDFPTDIDIIRSVANYLDGFDFSSENVIKILHRLEGRF
jgi:spore coat polysaccharide biosynthesis protein SpsF (cytidylyltransferase family)